MYQYLKIILFLIIFFNYLPSHAEVISTLSLEDALQIAMNNNPAFKAKTINIDIREAEIKVARARPNPSLLSDSGTAERTYRVGLNYNVELGGKRQKRIRISETLSEAEEQLLNYERLNFRSEIRQSYTQLYYAKKRLEILKQVKGNSEKLLEIAKKREQAGDIPFLEVLQTEVAKISIENQYEKALYQIREAHHQLEFLLNTELEENIQLSPPNHLPHLPANLSTDDISGEILGEIALENRPEIKASQLNQKLIEQELELTKSKRIPDLSLSAGPDFVTGNDSGVGAFIIAQVGLPILNLQGGAIAANQARKKQLILEHKGIVNRLKTEVEHACLAYIFQQKVLVRYEEELLPKVEELLNKSYRSFETGKSSALVSLKAQSDYMNNQLDYIQTLVDYQHSISLLEKAIGVEI